MTDDPLFLTDGRAARVANVAREYAVEPTVGVGRYAAVISRGGGRELIQGDVVGDLLAAGELIALVNLDLDGHEQA